MLDGALPPGEDLWRFGVLQLVDDYESLKRHRGVQVASEVLAVEPPRTGHSGVDASFAALTCWLADRDGWTSPAWGLAQTQGSSASAERSSPTPHSCAYDRLRCGTVAPVPDPPAMSR